MEYDKVVLRLNAKEPGDRRILSDLSLAFGRTVHAYHPDGYYPPYPELVSLENRITEATPWHTKDHKPRPVLELTLEEVEVCESLIKPAIRTDAQHPLPVDSMLKTHKLLGEILLQNEFN